MIETELASIGLKVQIRFIDYEIETITDGLINDFNERGIIYAIYLNHANQVNKSINLVLLYNGFFKG